VRLFAEFVCDGFDVFRWNWAVKDITGQPADYIVQAGDTLGLVAERWKTPAGQIARYNGLELDAALSVGQVLQIPPNEMNHQ
jgi:LysM repeat protein